MNSEHFITYSGLLSSDDFSVALITMAMAMAMANSSMAKTVHTTTTVTRALTRMIIIMINTTIKVLRQRDTSRSIIQIKCMSVVSGSDSATNEN